MGESVRQELYLRVRSLTDRLKLGLTKSETVRLELTEPETQLLPKSSPETVLESQSSLFVFVGLGTS